MKAVFIALAIAMCAYRMVIQPGLDLKDIFKDISHLFVGGLIGVSATFWWVEKFTVHMGFVPFPAIIDYKKFFAKLALAVTLFEVFCGVIGKHTGQPIF